ncbi:heart- and neural crest derivatives-expressed protein 1-like [Chanos chanos]|uniref:Heart- and neural crest derivatives-expressed protein 1 n=1 Tax=Chanos chanos TaxID=29144 RepID=A0A6J2WZD1_CHACN|nr:heart- and neural crest derivatives-expressed protein 1 [Chanos chanos]
MNLVERYQHHSLMQDAFPYVQRRQDSLCFSRWFVNPTDVRPEFQIANSCSAKRDALDGTHDGQLDALIPEMGQRRVSGPKKEQRRTQSINTAFAELRDCIPNVPADTKLSKIKTLRLATSYISYLTDVLAKEPGEMEAFKAEIKKCGSRGFKREREMNEGQQESGSPKRVKGRTGWPQQVWALELNQ